MVRKDGPLVVDTMGDASLVNQCVVLIGGLGTRLGELTKQIPKPLLPVGDRPFVDFLIFEASRRGFRKILLLAGHLPDVVMEYVRNGRLEERFGVRVELAIEPAPLGTGGALINAMPLLDEAFLLLNGDTWFDFNWRDLVYRARLTCAPAALALRKVENPDRYETIELSGSVVNSIQPRRPISGAALINGGVYYLTKKALQGFSAPSSLESDVFPLLQQNNLLYAFAYSGFFIDIGVPESYEAAQQLVLAHITRPAVFLDRDGVLNVDHGYVHSSKNLEWVGGAKSAVKILNDAGYYVFVVTNQAGVARGYYNEEAISLLHQFMNGQLLVSGAYIDDWRYCPFHPEATVQQYKVAHPWRKPEPGMILDLLKSWPIDCDRSFLVGDKQSDLAAANAAGIVGHLFNGANLTDTIENILG